MNRQVQPIFILPEGTERTSGKDAQRSNIAAAKIVAETVRTTLGPKGMDKMIVDSLGDIIITNDGVTILDEMQIEHPGAKMIVEIAKTQEDEVGDGTTTAVVIAGELLKNAEALLEEKVHPTVIAKGYQMAAEKAIEILDSIAEPISLKKTDLLKNIAITAMTGKGAESSKDKLADLCVKAVTQIVEEDGTIDPDNIKIEKKVGESADASSLIKGVVFDKERLHESMPRKVEKAKILLLDAPVEIKSTETDAKIQINTPTQMQAFLDQEERMLKEMVEKIAKTGANVVFCQKGIDDLAQHFLAKKGIYACRRIKKSDMTKLSKATGAKVQTTLDDISPADLGHAGMVKEQKIGDEDMTFVEECKNPKAVTLLVRGGTEHVVEEIKRAIDDAVGDLIAALNVQKIVAGAGAVEVEVSRMLRKYANQFSGREQLAVKAFADALEIIPKTLAENAGIDPIDVLTDLKAQHNKRSKNAGVNVQNGKPMDAFKKGVIEPLKIKTQAIKSASEVSVMILRIDDVIQGGSKPGGGMPPGMPPGMGM
ncbi:TCP-1/cpn60 chaperonin family protein [Candidatus Woesearchaeota archaeon]|nr:TCP-1/cpn60 chaperonin family protein [Candidatus Woesearchaeota archaeon]